MALSDENTPEFDVVLSKGGTEVGLILCNGQGIHDPMAISQEQQSRSAIKIASGDTKHSDYEPPYATDEVRDWSVGRGLDDADLEEGRFFDSRAAWTQQKGKILMGPQYTYGTGIRTSQTNMWHGTYKKVDVYGDFDRYSAKIVASSTYVPGRIYMPVSKHGSPDATITLYSDNAGDPDAVLEAIHISTTYEVDIIQLVSCSFSYEMQNGVTYHIAIVDNGLGDEDNHFSVMCSDGESTGRKYGSGAWTSSQYSPYYRAVAADKDYKAYFVRHHENLYAILDYDDNSAPKIFINGDFGKATGGTAFQIQDTTKTWTVNQWTGWQVFFYDGRGSESEIRHFDITANGTNYLSLTGIEEIPDSSTYYGITNGEEWFEVTGHGITEGPITDAQEIGHIVYIMRGDTNDVVSMRYPTLSTGEFDNLDGIKGSFIEYALDSNSLGRIWIATRQYLEKSTFPPPVGMYDETMWPLDLTSSQLVTNGNMEADASWSSVGSPTTQERSSEQAHTGTYSRKVVSAADNEGIGQTINTAAGDYYWLSGFFWVGSGSANGCKFMFAGVEIGSIAASEAGKWVYIRGSARATASTHEMQVLSDGGVATFYSDNLWGKESPSFLRTGRQEKITNLIPYGEPERVWAITDQGIYMEGNGNLNRVPIDEMRNAADSRNGMAATTYDVYLFFSFLNGGVERYYKSNLDDVGPDRDEGMPHDAATCNRRGVVSSMASYPTGVFMAVDGGDNDQGIGYGTVVFWNNTGYHDIWRSDHVSKRVRSIYIQPINGDNIDKLWINCGSDLLWVPIDKNPLTNSNFKYTYESVVEGPWVSRGKHDVLKYLDEVTLTTRVLTTSTIDVSIQYKLAGETSWTDIGTFTTAPSETLRIGSHDIETKKFKIRVILRTDDEDITPVIEAIGVDLIEDIPVKDSWTMQFLLKDVAISKTGKPLNTRVEDVITQLNTWKASPVPLYQEATHSSYDGKYAPIVGFTTRPIKLDPQGQEEEMVATITLIEA